MPSTDRLLWLAVAGVAGLLAGKLSNTALRAGWRQVGHEEPPQNPAGAPLGRAVLWTALLGAGAGLTKLLLLRGTAAAWQRTTGHAPPG